MLGSGTGVTGGNTIWNYGGTQDIFAGGGGGGYSYSTNAGGSGGTLSAGTGYSGGAGGTGNNPGGGGGGGSAGPSGSGGQGGNGTTAAAGHGGSGYGPGGSGGYESTTIQQSGTFPGGGGGAGSYYYNGLGFVYNGEPGANGEILVAYTPVYSGQVTWSASGSGSWGTLTNTFGTNWGGAGFGSPGFSPNFPDSATLGGSVASGTATVTLDGASPFLQALTFSNSAASYTLATGSGGTMQLNGGTTSAVLTDSAGSHSISAPVTLVTSAVVSVANSANALSISGPISGSGGLTTSGAGTVVLGARNSYTGGTTVVAGTLQGNTASLQGAIADNGLLVFSQTSAGTFAGSMSGSGNLGVTGGGSVTLPAADTSTATGAVSVAHGTLILPFGLNHVGQGVMLATGGTLNAAVSIKRSIAGNGTLIATNDLTIGASSQPGQFNMGGSPGVGGTLNVGGNAVVIFSADPAILGSQTTIGPGGSLTALNGIQLGNPSSVDATKVLTATGGAEINGNFINNGVANGPTGSGQELTFTQFVKGAGSTTGNVEYQASYQPSNSPNAVSVQNLLLDSTSTLIMELAGTTSGSGYDQLDISGQATLDGTLDVSLIDGFAPSAGDSFQIFNGRTSGSFDQLDLPSLSSGLSWNTSQLYATGTISVVPEPGTLALLGAAGAAMLLFIFTITVSKRQIMFRRLIVRRSMLVPRVLAGILIALGWISTGAHAQTLTTLASFDGSNGQDPLADLTLSGTTLYGTTNYGGVGYSGSPYSGDGVVFSLPVTGGSPNALCFFNGSNGKLPIGGLTISGSTLYGTATVGPGNSSQGMVFSLPITGGTPSVLASNVSSPLSDMARSGGILYGTDGGGGNGQVFSIPTSGGSLTILASLNGTNGSVLYAGATLSGGKLYGTANRGGAGYGTVFSIPVNGGTPTLLAKFDGNHGSTPDGTLVLSGTTLYGTTAHGGIGFIGGNYVTGYGTVFSLPVTGGSPTVLAYFNGSNGEYPVGGLTLSGTTLYGTATNAVFSLPITGGSLSVLASFTGSDGALATAGLTLSGNTLYGTTESGGAYNDGTVFALVLPTPTPEPGTLLLVGAMFAAAFVWRRCRRRLAIIAAIALLPASIARADVFNMPAGQTSLQFVTVGDPGNVADTKGNGAVSYNYQIGKFDVTLAQYTQFLNAVAADDTNGLYSAGMGSGIFPFGISRNGSPGSLTYAVTGSDASVGDMPASYVTWGDAVRFCNWLQNGQPSGAEDNGTTETGAYLLNGNLLAVASPSHNGSGAPRYFLPTEDEWHKAAYYIGGGTNAGYWMYPTQSNTEPDNSLALATVESNDANYRISNLTDPTNLLTRVGTFILSPGPYGTFDQAGDVFQWNESIINSMRGADGGGFGTRSIGFSSIARGGAQPSTPSANGGFRVASSVAVPEPGSIALAIAGGAFVLALARRRCAARRSG